VTGQTPLLALPPNAGRRIVEDGAVFCAYLLGMDKFVSYCKERDVKITAERLTRLERLGRFGPIFRARYPDEDVPHFRLPIRAENNWFEKGWAWDTTHPGQGYDVPNARAEEHEAYYSIFQLDELRTELTNLSINVELDWMLEPGALDRNWNDRAAEWVQMASFETIDRRTREFRRAIAFLCQMISERYYPYARSDQRRMQTGRTRFYDAWLSGDSLGEWEDVARNWDPNRAAEFFDLTSATLQHAYETLAVSQTFIDPLEQWQQLVQFVNIRERDRLKDKALLAENIRGGAIMLRKFYEHLYDQKLPVPHEVTGQIITHTPELEIRKDTRRYLEFVANRFHLNPQPLVALFVEGPTEARAIDIIFEKVFASHPGTYGIEVIVLGGVDNATGSKEDSYRAIFRLLDYLHHHQTITYIILDNERFARKLKAQAKSAKSIHYRNRMVTRPDHIKVWNIAFEFDNFTDSEIAKALVQISAGKCRACTGDVTLCRKAKDAGAALKNLYQDRVASKLDKMKLMETLIETMLSPTCRTKLKNRPIIKTLEKVSRLGARNPLPLRLDWWEENQLSSYLGTRRRRPKKLPRAKR
jgi:hypothetical protein